MIFYSPDFQAASEAIKAALERLPEGETMSPDAIARVALDAGEESQFARQVKELSPLYNIERASDWSNNNNNKQDLIGNLTIVEARKVRKQIKEQKADWAKRLKVLEAIEQTINESVGYEPPTTLTSDIDDYRDES